MKPLNSFTVSFLLKGMGIETGADLSSLLRTGHYICSKLKKTSNSKVAKALPIKETNKTLESYVNVRKGSLCVWGWSACSGSSRDMAVHSIVVALIWYLLSRGSDPQVYLFLLREMDCIMIMRVKLLDGEFLVSWSPLNYLRTGYYL